MPTRNTYYPNRKADQIVWLRNYRNKLGNYTVPLGVAPADLTATVADADRVIYLLDTINKSVEQFHESTTTHIRLIMDGPIGTPGTELPVYFVPSVPDVPANVAPGAIKRIFAFVKNLKTRTGYTEVIGEDLGIVGDEQSEDPTATPEATATARSGDVLITFKKNGHLGVWIETQVATETTWTHLAIDTSSPYNDTTPLKVAGTPEKRRYRLCFWDGDPTNYWSDILEVTYGG